MSEVSAVQKFAVFFGFVLAFGGLFGATYLMIASYLINTPSPSQALLDANLNDPFMFMRWPGVAVFLQNIFIFVSNMMMRFARKSDAF
jgi:hypothetical protein